MIDGWKNEVIDGWKNKRIDEMMDGRMLEKMNKASTWMTQQQAVVATAGLQ